MARKKLINLVAGDRFVAPNGQTLTVVEVLPADRAEDRYSKVITEETYANGENFTALNGFTVTLL